MAFSIDLLRRHYSTFALPCEGMVGPPYKGVLWCINLTYFHQNWDIWPGGHAEDMYLF